MMQLLIAALIVDEIRDRLFHDPIARFDLA